MTPQLRTVLLGLALVVTVLASVLDFAAVDDAMAPAPSTANPAAAGRAVLPAPEQTALERVAPGERFGAAAGDLFAARGWQAAPPALPALAMPPAGAAAAATEAATAPPLPFRYLGKLVHDGGITAFLGQGNQTFMAGQGDVLAGYRVEQISASEMTFIYLRLNEKQRLTFGSAL